MDIGGLPGSRNCFWEMSLSFSTSETRVMAYQRSAQTPKFVVPGPLKSPNPAENVDQTDSAAGRDNGNAYLKLIKLFAEELRRMDPVEISNLMIEIGFDPGWSGDARWRQHSNK